MNKIFKRGLTVATSLLLAATLSLSAFGCNDYIGGSNGNTSQDETNNNGSDNSGSDNSGSGGGSSSGGATHEHNYVQTATIQPTCTEEGYVAYSCTICSDIYKKPIAALGHDIQQVEGQSVRKLILCSRGCGYGELPQNANTNAEKLTYKFSADVEAQIADTFSAMNEIIESVGDYADEQYEEGSELDNTNEEFEQYFLEIYGAIFYTSYQDAVSQIQYNVDMSDESAKTNYQYVSDYYSQLVQNYYALFKAIYNSKLRNYFFHPYTEEQVAQLISYSESFDDELTELNNRNTEILLDYNTNYSSSNKIYSDSFTTLYAEFVENNKKIAAKLGYDNYLQYAYEELYSRDYTYQDVHEIAEYYKEYLASTLKQIYGAYYGSAYVLSNEELATLNEVYSSSFFSNVTANELTNDFLDEISLYGTINYAQLFEDLIDSGNYFTGDYAGAYTVFLDYIGIPVTFYGDGYQDPSTIVHEFGHYTNDYYKYIYEQQENNKENGISQSFDLLETHSHGMEYMYLSYLKNKVSGNVYKAIKNYELYNAELGILLYMAVNMFEEAVYTDTYEGTYSSQIMSDGIITSDEYTALFTGIMIDLGLSDYIHANTAYYWRYVVIPQPCYYVSYSISTLASLQFYIKAEEESLEAAVVSHNKIITYMDEHAEYNYSEVLKYAGLLDINDEKLYEELNKIFTA